MTQATIEIRELAQFGEAYLILRDEDSDRYVAVTIDGSTMESIREVFDL